MKTCNKCKKEKDFGEFHKNKRSPDGFKARCKSCRNIDNKAHREQNPEYFKEYREANIEHLTQQSKEYMEKNKKSIAARKREYAAENKDKIYKQQHKWYEKNKSKVKEGKRRRRDRQVACGEHYTAEDEQITLKAFNNKCFNCNNKDRLHIDHHKPLIKGFPLSLDNAVVLCEYCNKSKGSKNPEEFYNGEQYSKLSGILNKINK